MDSILSLTLIAGLLALLLSAAATPLVVIFSRAIGALDQPSERRVHRAAIPRLGGIAIALAYGLTLTFVFETNLLQVSRAILPAYFGFFLGGGVIFLAGVFDDLRGLGAKRKLLLQTVAASVAWWGGAQIMPVVNVPGLGELNIGVVGSYLATVIWILAFTNAINLIDGLDGLAGGVVFFAALTNMIVAIVSNNFAAAALNAALAGSVLGFLFYNFNPAKIFMGDTGSLFLGYVLSASALLSARQKESTLAALVVPLIATGLPLTDTVLAMFRRMLERRSIFSPDTGHLHHRLLALGLTHRRAVLTLYGASLALSGVAMLAAFGKDWQVGAALLGAVVVLAGIVRFSRYFNQVLRADVEDVARGVQAGLVDFIRAVSRGVNPSTGGADARKEVIAALQTLLEGSALLSFELNVRAEPEPLLSWENKPESRVEGQLVSFGVDVRRGAEPVGEMLIGCRCRGPRPPAELVVLLEIVAGQVATALGPSDVGAPE